MNNRKNNHKNLHILFEDADILVCKKPAGVATQSKNIRTPDMVSLLRTHLAEEQSKNIACGTHTPGTAAKTASAPLRRSTPPYLAVIHRLDQPVEGILVFAKNKEAAANLSSQLTKGQFAKHYRALVLSAPKETEGQLKHFLKKDTVQNLSYVIPVEEAKQTAGAKEARLFYRVLPETEIPYFQKDALAEPSCAGAAELDILLDTGRHHQIRLQLAAIESPIVGDQKYGSEESKAASKTLKLCAYELQFLHPRTGEPLTFSLLDS